MFKSIPALLLLTVLLASCGKDEPVVPTTPVVTTPVENQVERPTFNTDIDSDDAFDKALGEAGNSTEPQFVEVIDELDADSVQAAEEGEKLAAALAMNSEEVAASEARGVARAQVAANNTSTGLEIRNYSDELYVQTKGVKPAIVYFTAEDCETCADWEAGLRADAAEFTGKNALVLIADFEANADLVAEMNIPEPGWAMMLSGVGELMGPRPTSRLTTDELQFIFK